MEKKLYERRYKDYAVFSKIFAYPLNNDFKEIIINLFSKLIDFAKQVHDDSLEESLNFVINFLKNNNAEELNRIYTSLFISGAYGKILCPVESIYLDNTGLIMGEKRDIVLEIYAKDKLSLSDNFKEQEDHISAELSYISLKNKEILDNINNSHNYNEINNIDIQYNFINEHILPLLHYLVLDLKKYDKSRLYFETASILKKYIEYDYLDI
ncbi:MAG: molecular chaperone TorD family protein [Mucispirillum sp.]|nr:molecular chaperone TorD family protein [Mucispirillum sp.]